MKNSSDDLPGWNPTWEKTGEWTRAEWAAECARNEYTRKAKERNEKHPKLGFQGIFRGPTHTPYANFPLALLGIAHASEQEFRQFFRDYALMQVAEILLRQQEKDIAQMSYPRTLPQGFNRKRRRHQAIGAAMVLMRRKGGEIERFERNWSKAQEFLREHNIDENHAARVQISLALLRREHSYLTERDLRVLFAVNACCGRQGWRQVDQGYLGKRALGENPKLPPLSRRQVQEALYKLRDKGLIYCDTWRKRKTFVGKGTMPRKKFEQKVAEALQNKQPRRKRRTVQITTGKHGEVLFTDGKGCVIASYTRANEDDDC